MKILIPIEYGDGFARFMLKQTKNYAYSRLFKNMNKLEYVDKYLNSVSEIKSKTTVKLKSRDILIIGIDNIKCVRGNRNYAMTINSVKNVPGTFAKLYEICKLINEGAVGLNPVPIFTETKNYIEKHLDEYYAYYLERGLIS